MTGYWIQPKMHLKDLELRQAKRGQDRLIKLRDERREAARLERIANRVPKDRGTVTCAGAAPASRLRESAGCRSGALPRAGIARGNSAARPSPAWWPSRWSTVQSR